MYEHENSSLLGCGLKLPMLDVLSGGHLPRTEQELSDHPLYKAGTLMKS